MLASGSPRRLTLLGQIGITPTALRPASIDETPRRAEMPRTLAGRLSRAKATTARDQIADDPELADATILAADTVVAVGRRILGKPAVVEEAVDVTGVAVGPRTQGAHGDLPYHAGRSYPIADRRNAGAVQAAFETRTRSLHRLAGVARAKLAATRSRAWRAAFVQKLIGSYTNVVGLPLTEVAGLCWPAKVIPSIWSGAMPRTSSRCSNDRC